MGFPAVEKRVPSVVLWPVKVWNGLFGREGNV